MRRSVANNLNDIAKDHPEVVADIAARWMKGASPERKRLIRHACRTLIKKGHPKTLAVFGFKPPRMAQAKIDLLTSKVIFGESLQFTFTVCSNSDRDQTLVIDYVIHHQKANGSMSPKVFKWRTITLQGKETLTLTKNHPIRKVTTRVYYPGLHRVEVMVNGISAGAADFELSMP